MPKFQVTTPDGATHEFELTASRARFGRAADNDVVIPDGSVSSYHGEYELTDSGVQLTDRGSTNGTHVNGQRVESADIPWGGRFKLGSCDVVLIGDGGEEIAAESYEPEAAYEEPVEEEAAAPAARRGYSGGGYSSAPSSAAVITGLGSTPCPSQLRRGFGPKTKEKDSGGGMLMVLAVLGMLACGGAAFMIFSMNA
ncbi:type III secretion system (T3SS) inner membrane Yop/YscD-like protein [Roseimicrobium gellanilyticum]|uniref:Type III secretion system (T3SS) inner membrane Yop/YscD-like protein n=1 Tax=Roseimicrobium gellanilyticum TaxID=748857 RepID=A0A366HN37_9BACT|nr:FHA domain-containing protein [Roseimicrobium gellanilyticum]RBP43856.1 type III secretion system (T3SS) inner membrane Yop/YscD-like protein [Roseimicrobium gellanilyticum]